MLDEIISIALVVAFIATLFLMRQLLLTIGKPKKQRAAAARAEAVKSGSGRSLVFNKQSYTPKKEAFLNENYLR